MSLNCSHANGGVLLFGGERILIFYDGVEMHFEMTCTMPHFKGKKKGRVYLTTHRVIFNIKDHKDTLQSFAMPFHCMRNLELEQPVFGANYIKGETKAEQGGNWEGTGKFKMWFNNGGAIEFGQAMLQAGRLASQNGPVQAPMYPPPYSTYYMAPPPAYTPQAAYGFVPQHAFPDAPPADSVYMMESPPPYPGVDPNIPQQANGYPPQPQAGASAYYNPGVPGNVYMPQHPMEAPPAYDDIVKKKSE